MDSRKGELMEWANFTFSDSTEDESFVDCFNELIENVNEIQADDLDFNPEEMEELFNTENAKEDLLPVSSITVKETEVFSMYIFLLQNGSRIPLHDHQDMHGILKVLSGTIKITSYTAIRDVDFEKPEDIKNTIENGTIDSFIPVELKMSKNVTDKDKPCVLTPTEGNYHEIYPVGGSAAIFDILAPPYGERDCNYYKVVETKNTDSKFKLWLVKEANEPSFWDE